MPASLLAFCALRTAACQDSPARSTDGAVLPAGSQALPTGSPTSPAEKPAAPSRPGAAEKPYLGLGGYQDGRAVFGLQSIALDGNRWKFRQYGSPQSDPVLRLLEWQSGGRDGVLYFGLVQPGWTDQGLTAEFRHGGPGLLRVATTYARAEMHPDLTPSQAYHSGMRSSATYLNGPNGLRLGLYLKNDDVARTAKLLYPDYRADDAQAVLTAPRGRWSFDLGDSQRKVHDRNQQLSLHSRSTTLAVSYRPGARYSVRTSVTSARGETNQHVGMDPNGVPLLVPALSAEGTTVAVDAVAVPTDRLTIRGRARRVQYSRTVTGVGYDRGDSGGQVDLKYRATPRWLMRAGWRTDSIRFRNRAQGTDRPRIQSSWASAAFRPWRAWEIWGGWQDQRLSGDPARVATLPSGTPILMPHKKGDTGDLSPLAPDHLRRLEAHLSGPLPCFGGWAAGWVRDQHVNSFRILRFNTVARDLTFWQPLWRSWAFTGTLTSDRLSASQAYLQPWLSNDETIAGSIGGPVGSGMTLDLLASSYRVSGSYSITSNWYALAARRALSRSVDGEVRIQRERFGDRTTPGNSYRATSFVVEGRTRF